MNSGPPSNFIFSTPCDNRLLCRLRHWKDKDVICSTPKRCWEETREQFRARLKHVVDTINATCDVAGLCRDLPKRVDALKEAQGGRIKR